MQIPIQNRFAESAPRRRRTKTCKERANIAPHFESLEDRRLMSTYSGVDLGMQIAGDLNNHGQVVGQNRFATGDRAALWQNGNITDLGALGGAGIFSEATGISDAGHVTGYSFIAVNSAVKHAFVIIPEDTNADGQPDRWYRDSNGDGRNDLMLDLGVLGRTESFGWDVNASGVVVGETRGPESSFSRAFIWRGGVMTDLGTLGGTMSSANAINDAGQVVGWATNDQQSIYGFIINPEDTNADGSPDRWYRDSNSDGANDLMVVVPNTTFNYGADINTAGHAVGSGALWIPDQPNGTVGALVVFDGTFAATGINNVGGIVGIIGWGVAGDPEYGGGGGGTYAAIWENGIAVGLHERTSIDSAAGAIWTHAINDNGWILGSNDANWGDPTGNVFLFIPSDKPLITLANNPIATEGDATITFTVGLSNASSQTVTVDFTTVADNAVAGSDYQAVAGTLTWAPGQTTQTITVPVLDDLVAENTETLRIALSNPINGVITFLSHAEGTGTILDNEPRVYIINTALVLPEGDAGTTQAVFTVQLSAAVSVPVTVPYYTYDGDASAWYTDYPAPFATAGSDYLGQTGTLTIAPGETTGSIAIEVIGDRTIEETEAFSLILGSATGATTLNIPGVAWIMDDDTPPSVSIYNGGIDVVEGNSGTTPVVLSVSLSRTSTSPVTMRYATADGDFAYIPSATAGSDYQATSGLLTFAPGETLKTITVLVNGDRQTEYGYGTNVELFSVNLFDAVGAVISYSQDVITIVDDDPTIAVFPASVVEGNAGTTDLVFPVILSLAYDLPVTVNYATADGTAKSASDYQAVAGSVTFAPGDTEKFITVRVNGDTAIESDETFLLNLTSATGGAITGPTAYGTIENDDIPPTLSINDVSALEGNAGTSPLVFTVTLSAAHTAPVTVKFATANGTATTKDKDYAAKSGTLTFAAGETSKTITILATGDRRGEPDETFRVNLSGATNATIEDSQGVGVIVDDEPRLTVSDASILEGQTNMAALVFTVTLSTAYDAPVTFSFATANGSATTASKDYKATSGKLTFAPGETVKTITVWVYGDTKKEGNESLYLNLAGVTNSLISRNRGTGMILNDD